MSRIADLLQLKNHPVAIYRAASIPEGAKLPDNTCGITLLTRCAREGGMFSVDSKQKMCSGTVSGFGFGGLKDRRNTACSISEMPEGMSGDCCGTEGQAYFRNPEIALRQLDSVKDYGDGSDAIVFQDLDSAEEEKRPVEVVVFLVDAVRISVLMQLASYSKETPGPAVVMPYGYSCQQIYAIPRAEGESGDPRAVLGMTEMYSRRFVGNDCMSFAVPYRLYQRMVSDIDGSFLMKAKYQRNFEYCLDEEK